MVEAIAFGITAGLLVKVVSLVAEKLIDTWNLKSGLEKLRHRLNFIVALLNDAHTEKITMSTAQIWFDKLEDAATDAEAFLDELAYQVTRRNVKNRQKVWHGLIPIKKPLSYRHKIKSIHASFDKTFKLAAEHGLHPIEHLNIPVQPRDIRIITSFEDKTLVVGRDKDISNLVQTLCKNHE